MTLNCKSAFKRMLNYHTAPYRMRFVILMTDTWRVKRCIIIISYRLTLLRAGFHLFRDKQNAAWSSSSPLIFLQNTRCTTHTYHSRRQKFCCRMTACVEQFTAATIRQITSYGQLRQHLNKHIYLGPVEIAAHCDSWLLCALQIL